jgi:hypothetical protein
MSRTERETAETIKLDSLTGVTSDTAGSTFTNEEGDDFVIVVHVSKANGTNPTLDPKLQVYEPQTDNWVDTGDSVSQITGTGTSRAEVEHPLGAKLRLQYVTGGTSPDFNLDTTVYRVPTNS